MSKYRSKEGIIPEQIHYISNMQNKDYFTLNPQTDCWILTQKKLRTLKKKVQPLNHEMVFSFSWITPEAEPRLFRRVSKMEGFCG